MKPSTADHYFKRYAWKSDLTKGWLPDPSTDICLVLPAYHENHLMLAVESIAQCTAPSCKVVLLILINEPENAEKEVRQTNKLVFQEVQQLTNLPPWLDIQPFYLQLPIKKAGVGLARKIGMDQAARWFHQLGKRGILVCFDADCTCSTNYLIALEKHYIQEQRKAAVAFYEHPLNSASGIITYELHLRYYANALAFAGYPKSFQTVGSCISVDTATYIQAGGMNTRKAGEDFYFLHQVALNTSITALNQATIFPSDRLSDRVPFGTGKALLGFQAKQNLFTYSLEAFHDLKNYFSENTKQIQAPGEVTSQRVRRFLEFQGFEAARIKILQNAGANPDRIQQLFFNWWDGLKILKFIHFCRDEGDKMILPAEAISTLNSHYWQEAIPDTERDLLLWIRSKDRRLE